MLYELLSNTLDRSASIDSNHIVYSISFISFISYVKMIIEEAKRISRSNDMYYLLMLSIT